MLHRAILGSFERFIAILTEHYAGEFPFFIAPTQVIIVPIAESHIDYSKEIEKLLKKASIDVKLSTKNDSLNKRIRNAEKERVPMIVVVGDNERDNRTVAIRDRRDRTQYNMSLDEFLNFVKEKSSGDIA
jgi:threonyl-tRNA synthetase